MNTAVVDHTNAHVMKLQTTHISELDQKIETLNGRIGGYLSRVATQQVVMYGGLVILLLVAGLLLVVYKSLSPKNRLNRELSEQKKQLEEQRDKLEGQRDKLKNRGISLYSFLINWKKRLMLNWFSLRIFLMISVLH